MEINRSGGFRSIFTVAFYKLFQVRLGKLNVNDCPAVHCEEIGIAGARNRRKVTVKIRQNLLLRFLSIIFFFFLIV